MSAGAVTEPPAATRRAPPWRRLRQGLRARPTLAAALSFALLAVVFVSPALPPGMTLSNSDSFWFQPPWVAQKPATLTRPANPEVDDAPAVLQPFVEHTREVLPHIPLWNPYLAGGRPFLADAQSGIFSPFNVPAYVLPFFASLAWIAALKLFLAGFGTFLLARALGLRFGGAMLSGVVYAFNLWLVCWLPYPHASVWVMIPWLLLGAEAVIRRRDRLAVGGLAAVVAIQFLAGHPESSFDALFAAGVFSLLRLIGRRGAGWAELLRALGALLGAVLLGTALAALTLVPFLQLLLGSADIHQRAGVAVQEMVPRKYLLGALMPQYWGEPTQTPLDLFLLARAVYAGALPLMLAPAALLRRRTRVPGTLLICGGLALMVAFAIPPVFQIVSHLPIFSSGHNTRLIVLYMLCVALLAGFGLDTLAETTTADRRRRASWGVAALLFLLPLVWVLIRGSTSWNALGRAAELALGIRDAPAASALGAPEVIRGAALLVWLGFGGAAFVLVTLRVRGRLGSVAWPLLAVLLTAADLFYIGQGYNPAISLRDAQQPATGAIRYLEARRPGRFVSLGAPIAIPQDAIPMRYHLYEARGYDLPVPQRYDHFWRSQLSPEYPSQVGPYPQNIPLSLPKLTPSRLQALSLLGVTDVMEAKGDPPLAVPGVKLGYDGPDARVYTNVHALPRVFIAGAQTVASGGEDAFHRTVALGPRATGVAVTESPVAGLPVAAPGVVGRPDGSVRIAELQPEHVVVSADASRPGLVVLDDNELPGWNAWVDGRPAPIHTTDYLFRGVAVPAGRHTIVFRYQPLTWKIGWIISVVALLVLLVLGALGGRARVRSHARMRPGRPPAPH